MLQCQPEDLSAGVPCALMMSTTRRKMRGGTSTFPFIIMRTVPTERSRRAASRFAPPSSSAAFSTERLYTSPMRRSFPGVGLELRRLVELFEQRLRLDRLHEVQLESRLARALLVVVASLPLNATETVYPQNSSSFLRLSAES